MLTVWGKLIKGNKIIASDTYTSSAGDMSGAILECIEHFGRKFDMEAPMWHSLHTKQLGNFQKAVFTKDDFIDRISFDRFEMQVLEQD